MENANERFALIVWLIYDYGLCYGTSIVDVYILSTMLGRMAKAMARGTNWQGS